MGFQRKKIDFSEEDMELDPITEKEEALIRAYLIQEKMKIACNDMCD
jgi:hypothetical protein